MRVEKSTEARNKQRLTPRRVLKAAWIFIPLILAALGGVRKEMGYAE